MGSADCIPLTEAMTGAIRGEPVRSAAARYSVTRNVTLAGTKPCRA